MYQMMGHLLKLNTVLGVSIQMIILLVWSLILNWICSLKYGVKVAWFLVFMPILCFFVVLLMAYFAIVNMQLSKEDLKEILQGECEECEEKSK